MLVIDVVIFFGQQTEITKFHVEEEMAKRGKKKEKNTKFSICAIFGNIFIVSFNYRAQTVSMSF